MDFKNLFVFAIFLLIWKVCRVYGQAARVEYINQPYSSSVATTVQASPQLVVPAIIKPIITPYDSYIQETVPSVPSFNGFNNFNGYPNYAPSYPGPMPPIIIDDDDDDNLNLLYFLIFAMRNRRNCGGYSGGCNGNCGCGGGCNGGRGGYNGGFNGGCGCGGNFGGNCGGNCGGNYFGNCGGYDNSGFSGYGNCGGYSNNCGFGNCFFPYPIPYPFSSFSLPTFGCSPDNSCSCGNEPCQPGQGNNDINIIIKQEPTCTS